MKVVEADKLSETRVSHNKEIAKKLFIANGEILHLTGFSTSVFKPRQNAINHKHDTLYEVFHVHFGTIEFTINTKKWF